MVHPVAATFVHTREIFERGLDVPVRAATRTEGGLSGPSRIGVSVRIARHRGTLGDMDAPVIVHAPGPGGRRVTIRGEHAGTATSPTDVIEFLRRAGLDDLDATDLRRPDLVEWRGAGPDTWP